MGAPGGRRRPVAAALVRGAGRRAVLAPRLGPAGLRQDRLPDDDRGRLGGRVHEHRLPRLRGPHLPEARHPRPLGPRLHRNRVARAAHRSRAGADPLVPALARRRAERHRRGAADRRLRAPLDPTRPRSRGDARRVAQRADLAAGPPRRARAAARRRRASTRSTSAATSAAPRGSPAPAACRGDYRTISASTTRSRSPTTGSHSRPTST